MKSYTPFLFALCLGLFTISSCNKALCENTCPFNNDGVCDDGGADSEYDVCQLGTDCNDCGEREE
mgnify:CR=1 FL=1|jgi:hypothetical protein